MDDNNITNTAEVTQEKPRYIQKNMATCTSIEFLTQGNKIRKYVEGWLKDTKILELRKRKAKQTPITNDMTPEQKKEVTAANDAARAAQVKQNISDMLDACLETNAEQTLRVLAMLCFVEPAKANEIPVSELLTNFAQMLADDGVISFFASLMKWEAIVTSI